MDSTVIGITLIELFADINLLNYAQQEDRLGLLLGFGTYSTALPLMLTKSLKKNGLGWTNSAWDGWSNLLTTGYSAIILKEKLSQQQWLGSILIASGIFLLGDGRDE
jgi:multidrug transporter EmrE-like cation transporter